MIFAGMVSSVFASETLADSETIKQVQEALNEAGYNCGTADGIAGNKTKNAIVQYKTDKGLSDVSDSITEELLFLLGISEEPVELTKGIYRNAADELDPVIRLSETSDTLYIERDYGKEGLENIPVFFWDVCQILKTAADRKDYQSLSVTFLAKDASENIGITGIAGQNEFTSVHMNSASSDSDISELFGVYYIGIFGAHDNEVRAEKEANALNAESGTSEVVPKDYRNGRYWVFSCFDISNCKIIEMGDSSVKLHISVENTKYDGWAKRKQMQEAIEFFDYLRKNDSVSMPYNSIEFNYIDQSDNLLLYKYKAQKNGSGWDTLINDLTLSPFGEGVRAFLNGEDAPEEAKAEADTAESLAELPDAESVAAVAEEVISVAEEALSAAEEVSVAEMVSEVERPLAEN